MNLFQQFFMNSSSLAESETPCITLLYEALPTHADFRQQIDRIPSIEGDHTEPELSIEAMWKEGRSLLAELEFGKHKVNIAGIPSPVPEVAQDRCIWSSHWRMDLKEMMASHRANIILKYDGQHSDPIEQHIALYKAANVFAQDGLLGLVNEPAWTSHPPEILPNLVEPEMLQVCRDSPPLLYWTGLVIFQVAEFQWYVSRGHHLFGQKDFAYMADEAAQPLDIQNLFHELFQYCYFEEKSLQAGDVIQIGDDHYYEFYELDKELEMLENMGETLIVHPLAREEYEQMLQEME